MRHVCPCWGSPFARSLSLHENRLKTRACAASGLSLADITENAWTSVVQVIAGTGAFLADPGVNEGIAWSVTNEHVVGEDVSETVRLATGASYSGRVMDKHATLDLAYVQIDSGQSFAPIAIPATRTTHEWGMRWWLSASPTSRMLMRSLTITTAIISARRDDRRPTDAALNLGNSGWPVAEHVRPGDRGRGVVD